MRIRCEVDMYQNYLHPPILQDDYLQKILSNPFDQRKSRLPWVLDIREKPRRKPLQQGEENMRAKRPNPRRSWMSREAQCPRGRAGSPPLESESAPDIRPRKPRTHSTSPHRDRRRRATNASHGTWLKRKLLKTSLLHSS